MGKACGWTRRAAAPWDIRGFRLSTLRAARNRCSPPMAGYVIVFNGEIYNFQALRKELEQLGRSFARIATRKCFCKRISNGVRTLGPPRRHVRVRAYSMRWKARCLSLAIASALSRCIITGTAASSPLRSEIKAIVSIAGRAADDWIIGRWPIISRSVIRWRRPRFSPMSASCRLGTWLKTLPRRPAHRPVLVLAPRGAGLERSPIAGEDKRCPPSHAGRTHGRRRAARRDAQRRN